MPFLGHMNHSLQSSVLHVVLCKGRVLFARGEVQCHTEKTVFSPKGSYRTSGTVIGDTVI